MANVLPLPTRLRQALVACTIEFDEEFERRVPQQTTTGPAARSGRGPWLASMAMWSNSVRFVGPDESPLRDLEHRARLVNRKGLRRWAYTELDPDTPRGVVRLGRGGRAGAEGRAPARGCDRGPLVDAFRRRRDRRAARVARRCRRLSRHLVARLPGYPNGS